MDENVYVLAKKGRVVSFGTSKLDAIAGVNIYYEETEDYLEIFDINYPEYRLGIATPELSKRIQENLLKLENVECRFLRREKDKDVYGTLEEFYDVLMNKDGEKDASDYWIVTGGEEVIAIAKTMKKLISEYSQYYGELAFQEDEVWMLLTNYPYMLGIATPSLVQLVKQKKRMVPYMIIGKCGKFKLFGTVKEFEEQWREMK